MTSNWHSRATWGMTLGLLISLALLLLVRPGLFGPVAAALEYDTLDFWFTLREPRTLKSVGVIAVDEATVRRWNGRTFDARDIARTIRALKTAGARTVALDFPLLNDPLLQLEGTPQLAQAMREHGRVVLPLQWEFADAHTHSRAESSVAQRFAWPASPPLGAARLGDSWHLHAPGATLLSAAAGAGHLNFQFDRFGRAREMPLVARSGRNFYPAFALAVARVEGDASPAGHGESLLLNYPFSAPPESASSTKTLATIHNRPQISDAGAGAPNAFPLVSLDAALRRPELLKVFRGRAVVMGVTAPGSASRFPTPSGARISAAELQAVAVDNLLTHSALERAPEGWKWVFTLLPAIIVGGFASAWRPASSALVSLLCVVVVAFVSWGLFAQNVWLDTSVPWLAVAMTFLVGVIGRARLQERETTHVASTVEALARVSDIVAAQTRPEELLDRVLHFAAQILDASGAAALLVDERGEQLVFTAALGTHASALIGQKTRVGEGVAGHVARTGEVAIVNDARSDPRFSGHIDSRIGFATRSVLCVPLKVSERILGVLEVLNREGAPWTPDDAEVLQAVANQAAIALDNARLYQRLELRVEESQGELALANRQLQADKTLLQTVLHSMTDGVVVTDKQNRIQLVNPAAQNLVPELRRDVLGQPLARVVEEFIFGHARENDSSPQSSGLSPQSSGFSAQSSGFSPLSAGASAPSGDKGAASGDEGAASGDKGDEADVVGHLQRVVKRAQSATRGVDESEKGFVDETLIGWDQPIILERGNADSPSHIEARTAPLQRFDGEFAGLVAVFADVTQRRQIEQAKSDFVSFVAHEMRSPLTSISGFSAMLQRAESGASTLPTASRARFLGLIHEESERLTRLINNLLDVARLEAGRSIELNRERMDFERVARFAMESQRTYSTRHVLLPALAPHLPPVYADADKVTQILINLLSNALKYSPGGIVTLGARVENEELRVWVGDQGPGIAPEHQALLFSRFGRAPSPATGTGARSKPTGTGLGLFLTKYLVEAHGGHIWVQSEVGRGATFWFTLPLDEVELP